MDVINLAFLLIAVLVVFYPVFMLNIFIPTRLPRFGYLKKASILPRSPRAGGSHTSFLNGYLACYIQHMQLFMPGYFLWQDG
jgi:hypothetical protein